MTQRELNKKCATGQISVSRKGYTRKDGTKVKGSTFCIEDQGKPGKTSRGAKGGEYADEEPWIEREGKLGGPGYTKRKQKDRRKILRKCVKDYDYRSCLGSLMVLLRSSEIKGKTRKTIESDKKWLMKEFGGPGSFGPQDNPEGCGCGSSCGCHDCMEQYGAALNPADDKAVQQLKAKLLL